MSIRRYKSVLVNPCGDRITVILPSEMRPPWRQPGEVAHDYANNVHDSYPKDGPWTVVETDVSA